MRGYKMDKKPVKMTEKEMKEQAMKELEKKMIENKDVFIRLRDK